MIDIVSFSESFKATWIKKYFKDAENRGKWKLFFDLELKAFGGKTVLTGNLNTNDSINILQSKDSFI